METFPDIVVQQIQFTQTIYFFFLRQLKEHTGGEGRHFRRKLVKVECGEEAKEGRICTA
jgi:hypothetical protein